MSGPYVDQWYGPPSSAPSWPRPFNGWAWGLAFVPLILAVGLELLMAAGVPGLVRRELRLPLALVLTAGMVLADHAALRRAAAPAPSPWWALLGPVYLFVRPRALGPSPAMGATWFASLLGYLVVPLVLALTVGVHISTDRVAHRIQVDLERQTGLAVTVTCPPPTTLRIGSSFDCALHSGPYDATATVTITNTFGGYRYVTHASAPTPVA